MAIRIALSVKALALAAFSGLALIAPAYAQDTELTCFADVSESMKGSKIEAVKESMALLTAIVDQNVRLQFIAFNDQVQTSSIHAADSPENQKDFDQFIASLQALGATNYLNPVNTRKWASPSVGIFLSDGMHNGNALEVRDAVKAQMHGRMQLHTVAIDCDQPDAEQLLIEMATATGGSFCSARTSEDVVRRFVEVGVRHGSYRSHRPVESAIVLRRAVGRVLAFAYDGEIDIRSSAPLNVRKHVANLPGESVALVSVICEQPTDLTISLMNPKKSTARLGDVYVQDLPTQTFDVDAPSGSVATGSIVQASFGFSHAGQSVQPGIGTAAQVDVLDNGGQVLNSVRAMPKPGGQLEASVRMPRNEGAVTMRGTSRWVRDGREYSQSDERTVLVQSAPELILSPQQITGSYPRGKEFRIPLKATWKDTGLVADVSKADLVRPVAGLRLESTTITAIGADLHFLAGRSGPIDGSVKFSATRDGIAAVAELPFGFVITSDDSGLHLPATRRIDLPDTISGGSGSAAVEFPTQDKAPVTYTLAITDASSDDAAVPMSLDIKEIEVSNSKPGRAVVSWNAIDAPTGTYRATITASTLALPDQDWVTELVLPVTPALSAAAIDVQVVPGRAAKAVVQIQNRSSVAIKGLTLEAPDFDDQVYTNIKPTEFLVPANGSKQCPIEFLLSPLFTELGIKEATINVVKEGHIVLRVPVKVTIVDPADRPVFKITPSPVRLNGSPGDVLQFKLLVRATDELPSATTLTASIGSFSDAQKIPTIITASLVADGTDKLRTVASTVSLKGIVVCPRQSGVYAGEIEVNGSTGGSSNVLVHLVVK